MTYDDAGDDGAGLLLLPIEEIGGAGPESAQLRCPRTDLIMVNRATGEWFPLRCKANKCWYCGPRNAVGIAVAQARSNPVRSIRFSKLPADWSLIRVRVKQVREALADEGLENEWCYSVEPNPSGEEMAHAHFLQHGDYVPQGFLQEVCERNGLGIPYIEAVKCGDAAAAYGVKAAGAAWYGMKLAGSNEATDYFRFLELNGGRLSHHTRGFYRDPDGQAITQGEALQLLRVEKWGEEDRDQWVIVHEGQSPRSAALDKLRALGR